jgi:hypothetical protein
MVFHGGTEYDPKHNANQTKFAENWIKRGADLVIMHHPHVVQGVAVSRNRTICYSLGNFVFGGNSEIREEPWRGTRMATSLYAYVVQAELYFADGGEYLGQQVSLYPVLISSDAPHNNYQPYLATGAEAEAVLEAIQFDTAFPLPAFDEETGRVTLDYLSADGSTGTAPTVTSDGAPQETPGPGPVIIRINTTPQPAEQPDGADDGV